MPTKETLQGFLQQASASGSRSTVLHPLAWLTGILASALVLSTAFEKKPEWVIVLLASLLVSSVVLYLIGYIYFAIKNPDALRSEKFNLSKMAIEKNLMGDNVSGLIEIEESIPNQTNTPISFIEEAQ